MFELFTNPSTSMPLMVGAITVMNYYIRKHQMVMIKQYYDKMIKEQEKKTSKLAYDLLTDICLG